MIILATEAALDWGKLVVEFFVALVAVFTCTGFWELKKAKFQAKREDKKEEKNYDAKFEELSHQLSGVIGTMGDISDDMQILKRDLAILQEANEATVQYRELRDKQDKDALEVQKAVIISLKGMLRERLLDNYNRCIAKGYYTREERETYGEMFRCYESEPFDGNGIMHQLQPIMQALPWTKEGAGKLNDPDSED